MNPGLVGFALGWAGSMPLGGPVSLFVLKRGVAGRYRDAILLATGAALAEAAYCAAALFGYGFLLDRWPMARPVVEAIGALIMVGLGVYFLVTRHFADGEIEAPTAPGGWIRDLTLGFSMVGFNPSVMMNWLVVLAALHAVGVEPETLKERLLFAGSVAAGIVAWFTVLTGLMHHGRARVRPAVLGRVLRVFGGGLCAAGIYVLVTRVF